MPDTFTPEERQAEIERLERKLAASRGMDGYGDRIAAIEARLRELRDDG